MKTQPKRPYLLRALYEWLVDSDLTPYLLVDAEVAQVQVPRDYVADGRIVLNISPSAIRNLTVGKDGVAFDGRFGGKPFAVYLPLSAVTAIYASETGEGMIFEAEEGLDNADAAHASPAAQSTDDSTKPKDGGGRGKGDHLKVVK